jgi:hypothetical protein
VSQNPKSEILYRISKSLIFLQKPHTVKELSVELGTGRKGANAYILMLRRSGYSIRSRERSVTNAGINPTEYWLVGLPGVLQEALELMRVLKGM